MNKKLITSLALASVIGLMPLTTHAYVTNILDTPFEKLDSFDMTRVATQFNITSPIQITYSGKAYVCDIASLSVRQGPLGTSTYLGTLNKGQQVEIVGFELKGYNTTAKLGFNEAWAKIKYNNGFGYVMLEYLRDYKEEKYIANIEKVAVTKTMSAPTQENIDAYVTKGQKVEVLEYIGSWAKIQVRDEDNYAYALGYVLSSYLGYEKTSTMYVTDISQLSVRETPSTTGKWLAALNKGTKVDAIEQNNGWTKIKYNNSSAYVMSSYLSEYSDFKYVSNIKRLALRSSMSTESSYNIENYLYEGERVRIVEYIGDWAKLITEDRYGDEVELYMLYKGYVSDTTQKTVTDIDDFELNKLTIRETPSETSKVLGYLNKDVQVDVLREGHEVADEYSRSGATINYDEVSNWSKIKYNEKYGYVKKYYLDDIRYVSGIEKIALYDEPSVYGKVVKEIVKGEKVIVMNNSVGEWIEVNYDGNPYFVHGYNYLNKTQGTTTPIITTMYVTGINQLSVRNTPTTAGTWLGGINKGTKVEVLGTVKDAAGTNWAKIKYNNAQGYAYVLYGYLSNQAPVATTTPMYVSGINQLSVRETASTSGKWLGGINKGTKVDVIENTNGWAKIKYTNTQGYAYVMSSYLSTAQPAI